MMRGTFERPPLCGIQGALLLQGSIDFQGNFKSGCTLRKRSKGYYKRERERERGIPQEAIVTLLWDDGDETPQVLQIGHGPLTSKVVLHPLFRNACDLDCCVSYDWC
eukprot:2599987-Amphidinium_carterae.1